MKIVRLEEITDIPELRELTPEEIEEAYRLHRETLTAADMQQYAALDTAVPADQAMTEFREILKQRQAQRADKNTP